MKEYRGKINWLGNEDEETSGRWIQTSDDWSLPAWNNLPTSSIYQGEMWIDGRKIIVKSWNVSDALAILNKSDVGRPNDKSSIC